MSESQYKQPINNSTFTTPQKRSNSRREEQSNNYPTQGKDLSNNNLYAQKQAQYQSISNNLSKNPTATSLNQDGQYNINKSINENDSSLPNLLKSQIPQLSQYEGNPQELVNHLTGRVFSLVEQIHKLSTIIDEMTVGQQYLSEKYLELRSVYYQLLLENGFQKPNDQNSQWNIMDQSGSNKSSFRNTTPPRSQQANQNNQINQLTSRGQSIDPKNQYMPQNVEQVKRQQPKYDQVVEIQEERVKRSLKNKDQQQSNCQNCEVRNKNEQQMRQEIEQLRTSVDAQNAEIQRLRSYLNKTPVGFIEIDVYKNQNNACKSQSVANSPYRRISLNNQQNKNGRYDPDSLSLKDSMGVLKEYITDRSETQNRTQRNLLNQYSPLSHQPPKQINYPQTTKNQYQQNTNNAPNLFKARNQQVDFKLK